MVAAWGSVDAWGKRKLAYEIDHKTDAWYFVLSFDSSPEALDEATRVLAITDGVMRHMATTRIQDASKTTAAACRARRSRRLTSEARAYHHRTHVRKAR